LTFDFLSTHKSRTAFFNKKIRIESIGILMNSLECTELILNLPNSIRTQDMRFCERISMPYLWELGSNDTSFPIHFFDETLVSGDFISVPGSLAITERFLYSGAVEWTYSDLSEFWCFYKIWDSTGTVRFCYLLFSFWIKIYTNFVENPFIIKITYNHIFFLYILCKKIL